MRYVQAFSILSLLVSSSVGTAAAADLTTVPVSTSAALPVTQEAGFNWSGFYAGVYGTVRNGSVSGTQYGLGLNVGVNTQFDFYLLGAEVAVEGLEGGVGETTYGQILGRAGLVATDNVVVYAAGGYGIDLGAPQEQDALVGGGVEMAVSNNVSVRAQYLHGFATEGGNDKDQVTIGALFHF